MEPSKQSEEPTSNTLTPSSEASLVRTSPLRVNKPELRVLARVFGLSSPVLLGNLDLDSSSLRTSQASLFTEQCAELSENFPSSGMWGFGECYELLTSEHPINGNESLSLRSTWPTARAEDGESCGNHPGAMDSLTGVVKHWPTPTEDNANNQGGKSRTEGMISGTGFQDLTVAAQLWATPQAHDMQGPKSEQQIKDMRERTGAGVRNLNEEALTWFPTPCARDAKGTNKRSRKKRGSNKSEQLPNFVKHLWEEAMNLDNSLQVPSIPDGETSSNEVQTAPRRLNPRFVEWLMGFPIGYTEL